MIDYTNSQIAQIIDEYIHNAKHRTLLKDRYIDGLTFEELAEKNGLSVRHCKTLIYRLESELFKHIK